MAIAWLFAALKLVCFCRQLESLRYLRYVHHADAVLLQAADIDLNRRYESLTEKNDPLVAIAAMVPFESFRLSTPK